MFTSKEVNGEMIKMREMERMKFEERRELRKRMRRRKLFWNAVVCCVLGVAIIMAILCVYPISAQVPSESKTQPSEPYNIAIIIEEDVEAPRGLKYAFDSTNWTEEEKYLLAKIAMAEAEGCSIETKSLVIATVLNRVEEKSFPDSIKEVIYQKRGNVYQFSPLGNGRWNKVEPNEDCYTALEKVMKAENDFSNGALYFESCKNANNWHSRNLKYLCKSDTMRFYKHKT